MAVLEVFVEESLQKRLNSQELKVLSENFKSYKENLAGGILGFRVGNDSFGKDEGLTQPPEIRGILYKIHIKPNQPRSEAKSWSLSIRKGFIPTSDHVLIYCQGKIKRDKFLLIDIFRPKGHLKMKDFEHLIMLKETFADPFREQF